MNTLSFPQITVSYKDADASKRVTIHSSKESYDQFKPVYEDCMQHHEECWAMYLTPLNKVLGVSCISRNGINCAIVDIRIILQTALVSHASAIILSHNHPSGSTKASPQDNSLTSHLKKACETIDIQLLDHIILTEDSYLSYADEGML
ncbi:RadC family protein [Bacteroides sp. HPS0048]|uniref:JAB domain-containing protein n=1 Tax=Bacteroides sp. HPS0048 TaxID=1078089 RepID=UPI003563FC4D